MNKAGFSQHFHNSFEGYAEKTVQTKSGKKKIERVYVADYYQNQLTAAKWNLSKVLYIALLLLAVFGYIMATTGKTKINQMLFFAALYGVTALLLLWLLYSVLLFCSCRRTMTIGEYREGPCRLKRAALCCSVLMGINFIAALFYMLYEGISGQGWTVLEVAGIFEHLLSAVSVFVIYVREKGMTYSKVKNDKEAEEGDFVISKFEHITYD